MLKLLFTFKSTLGLVLLGLLLSPTAFAGNRGMNLSTADHSMGYNDLERVLRAQKGPLVEGIRDSLRRQLLTSDDPSLNMPDFPRTWLQITDNDTKERVFTYGLVGSFSPGKIIPLDILNLELGATYVIRGSYRVTTTFVAMARLYLTNAEVVGQDGVTVGPASAQEVIDSMYTLRPEEAKNYFLASKDKPMVGFCIYEIAMTAGNSTAFSGKVSFSVASGGVDIREGTEKVISQAAYSRVFQIQGNTPVNYYATTVCGKEFKEMVQPGVDQDFRKLAYEYNSIMSPDKECVINGKSDEKGDESCLAWGLVNYNDWQKGRIARCVPNPKKKGWGSCEMFSKQGFNCPMWYNEKGVAQDRPGRLGNLQVATDIGQSCDPKGDLKCTIDQKPLGGWLVTYPTTATCKPK